MKKTLTAPAKINLHLEVVRKRKDGYHEIKTLFMPVFDLADTISLTVDKVEGIEITSNSSEIPLNEKNICYKAAVKFAEIANISPAWIIHIEKNIPVSAGLGGGSSNAAALLLLLKSIYSIDKEDIYKIATQLGADVPFFLDPNPAVAEGVGEKISFIGKIPALNLVLINPEFPVSAAWGYKNHIKEQVGTSLDEIIDLLRRRSYKELNDKYRNDLQPAAFRKFPILEIIKDALMENGAEFAGMSGSGPTIFAVFADEDSAKTAKKELKQIFPNMRVF